MYILDLIGTLAFAISGAYKAKGRELNIFGVVSLGIITAVGGGTVRDVIIGRTPLFYLIDYNYLLVTIIGGVLIYLAPIFFKKTFTFFRFLDSVGLAAFAIIGVSVVSKSFFNGGYELSLYGLILSLFFGVLTACGGGVLRDAIVGDVPFALKHGSNYIKSSFWGALSFYLIAIFNINLAVSVSILVTLILREVVSQFGIYNRIIKKNENNKN